MQHILNLRAVFIGKHQRQVEVDMQVGDVVACIGLELYILLDAEVGTELLHGILHLDAGVHAVRLFCQFVKFELKHLVFADGADVVAALRVYI